MKYIIPIIAALVSVGCATSDDATPDTLATDTMQQSRSGEASDARISSFRAVGQEPGWLLTIEDSLRLQWDYDARQLVVATPRVQVSNGERTLEFRHNDTTFVISIRDTPCADVMSGHQFPATVTVRIGERVLNGCGGEVASLVRGIEWNVDSLDGKPLVAGSNITMLFADDNSVTGTAGCNRYRGQYETRGNDLVVRQAISTKMACNPDVDRQEVRFLEIIGQPLRFHIESNTLHLMLDNTDVIIARRR